jgi:hypothetical protein
MSKHIGRKKILRAIRECGGNVTQAAGLLKVSKTTLYHKIAKLKISREDYAAPPMPMRVPTPMPVAASMEQSYRETESLEAPAASERDIRRLTAADFNGANRGDVGALEPRHLEARFWSGYRRVKS